MSRRFKGALASIAKAEQTVDLLRRNILSGRRGYTPEKCILKTGNK